MTKNRTRAVAAVVGAAFAMSGCFVESTNLPEAPQFLDDRLVGAWQGVEAETNEPVDVYLHFQHSLKARTLCASSGSTTVVLTQTVA